MRTLEFALQFPLTCACFENANVLNFLTKISNVATCIILYTVPNTTRQSSTSCTISNCTHTALIPVLPPPLLPPTSSFPAEVYVKFTTMLSSKLIRKFPSRERGVFYPSGVPSMRPKMLPPYRPRASYRTLLPRFISRRK